MQETWVWSLSQEHPPGEGNGNPLQYPCWEIPWTEEPGGLWSTGHKESDMIEWLTLFFFFHWLTGKTFRNKIHLKCCDLGMSHCLRNKGGTEQPGRDTGFYRATVWLWAISEENSPRSQWGGIWETELELARNGGSLFHHGEADRLMRAMTDSFKYDLVTPWDFFSPLIGNIHISSLSKGCS